MEDHVRLARPAPHVIGVLLIVGLSGAMAVEPTRQLLAQRDRVASMTSELELLERSNKRLETRIERLKNPDFLEHEARKFGLVRPGETSILLMRPRAHRSSKERKGTPRTDRPEPGFVASLLEFLRG